MQLLTKQRTEYSLNAALSFLHQESMEWRMEVELWLDEMVFFYKLIRQRQEDMRRSPAEIAELQKELIALHSDMIDRLKREILQHEMILSKLLQTESNPEENYRQTHVRILKELTEARKQMREFKTKVFRAMAP